MQEFLTAEGVDERLIRAAAALGWGAPTLVQSAAVPRAIAGKDVLVHARTGAGKTGAYAIPLLQKLLRGKLASATAAPAAARAVVLVPTRELAAQTKKAVLELCKYCRDAVTVTVITTAAGGTSTTADVVVGTPAAVAAALARHAAGAAGAGSAAEAHAASLDGSHVETLVVDEADLVLSYGHADDARAIVAALPKSIQVCGPAACRHASPPHAADYFPLPT